MSIFDGENAHFSPLSSVQRNPCADLTRVLSRHYNAERDAVARLHRNDYQHRL